MNVSDKISKQESNFVKTKDFTKRSQWYQLKEMIEQGLVTKVKRGVYYYGANEMLDQTVEISKVVSSGVFCLFTAWRYYSLSTQNPVEFHIAVTQKKKVNLPENLPVKIYYWSEMQYSLGVSEKEIERQKIKIYNLEKSVCDAVKFRNKIGLDTTIEVLKNYVKRHDKNLNKLSRYAAQMRVENILQTMIMPLL
ncbi:MAG: hypothetical protein LBK97_04010 [Prevotellaceae bacterium]|nr:hypothetical protein [Prevotellaceae bacterium]